MLVDRSASSNCISPWTRIQELMQLSPRVFLIHVTLFLSIPRNGTRVINSRQWVLSTNRLDLLSSMFIIISSIRPTCVFFSLSINVAFSSFSVLEFSVNRLISDLSATFSADKASTFRASSSVSACFLNLDLLADSRLDCFLLSLFSSRSFNML